MKKLLLERRHRGTDAAAIAKAIRYTVGVVGAEHVALVGLRRNRNRAI
jgi:hypothetical protein